MDGSIRALDELRNLPTLEALTGALGARNMTPGWIKRTSRSCGPR